MEYFWKCPNCEWLWTIGEDQFEYFPVNCLNCEEHILTVEEVKQCPSQEKVIYDD